MQHAGCVYTWFQYVCIEDAVYCRVYVSASVDLYNYLYVYTMAPVKACNCVCAEGVYNDFCSYLNSTAVVYARNKMAVYVILSCMECHRNNPLLSIVMSTYWVSYECPGIPPLLSSYNPPPPPKSQI